VTATLVAALAVLPYLRTLRFGLVAFDDPAMITANPLAHAPTWAAFTSFYMTTYQPLGWWLYGFVTIVGRGSPQAYHAASVLLHGFNAALVFLLLRAVLPRGRGAEAAAALAAVGWAWHPVQAESVAWASQLSDLLCASFVLAGLLARERGRPGLGLCGFAAAALCRWKALAYPVFALALDRGRRVPPRPHVREYAAMTALSVAAAAVNAAAKASGGVAAQFRPQELCVGLLVQLGKIVKFRPLAPGLLLDGGDNPLGLGLLGALLAFVLLAALVAFSARRRPAAAVAAGAFALAAAPPFLAAAGSVPVFDHHLYLPSLAVAALAAAALRRAPRPALAAAAAFVAVLGFAAFSQAGIWRDSETLWDRSIAVHPLFPTARLNLAAARASAERPDLALISIDEQLAVFPRDREARELRRLLLASYAPTSSTRAVLEARAGAALFEAGRWTRAALRLRTAVAFAPRDPSVLGDAAVVLAALGERREAAAFLKRALAVAPNDVLSRKRLRLLDAAPPPPTK
jgi:tetratricopeptide (TPR) repeat protein